MKCPFCGYLRKKCARNPHWQCPKCEKAYNKFQPNTLNKITDFERPLSDKEKVKDFVSNCATNIKGLLALVISIFLLFWGIEEFLTEGAFYISNYYEHYQVHLENEWFVFGVLILLLLFLIGIVGFIGHKVFRYLAWH